MEANLSHARGSVQSAALAYLGKHREGAGIGSQVQRPLALVVVGGILLAPALILVILPVLIDFYSRRGTTVAEPGAGMKARGAS